MKKALIDFWSQLESRERMIVSIGSIIVVLILFYALILQPWHRAISHMEQVLPNKRTDLVWMREQAKFLSDGSIKRTTNQVKGGNQSLLSILEQTARQNNVRQSIQQMVPGRNANEVSVVLEQANFNQWVRWIDALFIQYGVNITQLTAEKTDDEPNIADIRVTFDRG